MLSNRLDNKKEGIDVKGLLNKIKELFKNYLERMANANKKEFGGNTLDCCKLNKGNANKHRPK